jgi:hypothetical protein
MLFSKITIRLNRTPFQNQQVIKGLFQRKEKTDNILVIGDLLSLLNTDIKIASAALANRLRPILPVMIKE